MPINRCRKWGLENGAGHVASTSAATDRDHARYSGRCPTGLGIEVSAVKPLRSVGLITKLNVLTIGLILVTAVSIALFLLQQKRSHVHAELLEHAVHLARILASNSEYRVHTDNHDALNGVMNSVTAAQEISYVAVLDRAGRELGRRQAELTVPAFAYDSLEWLEEGVRYSERHQAETGARYFNIVAPVYRQSGGTGGGVFIDPLARTERSVIGYVQIGVNQRKLAERMREGILSTALITGLVVLIGVLLTVFITRRIVAPLSELARATEQISDGNLDYGIRVGGHDEIGRLASGFDAMLQRLRASRREVETYQNSLETQVEHRTHELNGAKEAAESANRAKS